MHSIKRQQQNQAKSPVVYTAAYSSVMGYLSTVVLGTLPLFVVVHHVTGSYPFGEIQERKTCSTSELFVSALNMSHYI